MGQYKKAHDAFVAALKVDSAYMKEEGIQEVDNWNYIHNINYLIANCAMDGRHAEGLYYAQKLKSMPVNKDRKNVYDGTFFYQGILAPARMEMAFGYWNMAVRQLDAINDKDTLYNIKGVNYKNGLALFAKGMDAISKNDLPNATKYSHELDAFLWRNEHQGGADSTVKKWDQDNLNAGSLELQGCVKSAEGNYKEAVSLLEQAQRKEKEMGYSEPPSYARPVGLSLAAAYEKAGKWDKAIEVYESILKRFPDNANVYYALVKVYRKKNDTVKAQEYENKLRDASKYSDKGMYTLSTQKSK